MTQILEAVQRLLFGAVELFSCPFRVLFQDFLVQLHEQDHRGELLHRTVVDLLCQLFPLPGPTLRVSLSLGQRHGYHLRRWAGDHYQLIEIDLSEPAATSLVAHREHPNDLTRSHEGNA